MKKPSYKYTPIEAEAHTPPYKIHKYFARRPHNVFHKLIEEFTMPNEIVLDPFCGGGVTIYEGLIQSRKVIGCDLNPLSIFIVRNMVKKYGKIDDIKKCFSEIRDYIEYLTKDYLFFKEGSKKYPISWSELALTVRCPSCGRPTRLTNDLKIRNGIYHCENLSCQLNSQGNFETEKCERMGARYLFFVNSAKEKLVIKSVEKDEKDRIEKHLMFLRTEVIKNKIQIPQDIIPLDWDRQFEDGLYKKGILFFQDFFTKRNLMILLLLKNKIDSYEKELGKEKYELVRIMFSNVLKDCNIMSFTNTSWQGGKPTTWSRHAYWIPNQFCEVPVMSAFESSTKRILACLEYNQTFDYIPKMAISFKEMEELNDNMLLYNATLGNTDLPEACVDAIITDPPYGSNVQYLELSHFWYPWNKDLYDKYPIFELEAVANRKKGFTGAKSQYDYEDNLYDVFRKAYIVLKPTRYMVLTFNNKDICSWLALLFSIFKAGFCYDNMYFQDGVKNYRQTAHTKAKGSPYGDFIYVFRKIENQPIKEYQSELEFIEDIDNIFLKEIVCNDSTRNEIILQMFSDAIPFIDAFSKTFLSKDRRHNLYEHFNKKYLSKLYKNNENK